MVIHSTHILLADDDLDDCLFFKEALEDLQLPTTLTAVRDGEQLMQLLNNKTDSIPDVLFIDLNMPLKNGFTCLEEIKCDKKLKQLPIIIISTSFDDSTADLLYKNGASYYICKPAHFSELKKLIQLALSLVSDKKIPNKREDFLLNTSKTIMAWH